ncbi:MAG TPA: hypothetical protein VGD84_07755 [Pseudonocardiaceae bacterium]
MATSSASVGQAQVGTRRNPLILLMSVVGTGLLLTMAGIHFYLWLDGGYRDVPAAPLIGPLFLANTVGGVVLGVALLVAPPRWHALVALLSLLFDAGTLLALLVSLRTTWPFGFQESLQAPLVPTTIWVEAAGVVVLAVLTVVAARTAGYGFAQLRRKT